MSIVNSVKGFIRTITGALPLTLTNCVDEESIIDYTLYGNSVQDGTPAPETPVEVESVGEKTRNLFNPKQTPTTNGTYLGIELKPAQYTLKIVLKEGKSVPSGVYFGIMYNSYALWFIDNGKISSTTNTIDVSNYKTVSVSVYSAGGNTKAWNSIIDAFDIYLTEGTITTNEPYGYKIPITVSGKNLISNWNAGWCTAQGVLDTANYPNRRYTDFITIKPNTSYYVSGGGTNSNWTVYDENYNYLYGQIFGSTRGIKHSSAKYVRLAHTNSDVGAIQLEEGRTATEYEPYHEPITTNIYLDEPLRKVGDYADYIDFENSKIVRNIVYDRIDTVTTKSSAGLMFLSPITQKPMLTNQSNSLVGYAMSDKFKRHTSTYAQLPAMGKNAALIQSYRTSGGDYRVAYTFGDSTITTVALAQEAIGDGFDVFYALATPIETPITLPNIPTFKGTSVLTAGTTTQPSNAEIEYYSNVKE